MTVEELKAEAKKLGYKIIPVSESIKLLPCVCGCKRRTHWWTVKGMFYQCNQCGLKAPIGENETEAKKLWNKMIEENKHEL